MSAGGLFDLEPFYTYARACGIMALLCASYWRRTIAGVRDLPSQGFIKWPWSQDKHVWYNAKNCVLYFSPSFPVCISLFSAQCRPHGEWQVGPGLDTSGNFYCMPVGYWLKSIVLPQFTATKYLVLLETTWEMALRLLHFPTSSNHPMAYLHGKEWTDLWKL